MKEATTLPMLDRRAGSGIEDREITIDGHTIALTNLDRVMYPATGFTKADLVAHYYEAAPRILPFLADRALTAGRFPGGVDGRGFAQMELPGTPEWIRTVPIQLVRGDIKRFCVIESRAALVWLAQMGTIELHTFLGTVTELTRPTHVVLDLDPGPRVGLLEAAETALALLDRIDGEPLVKTSGAAGIHILIPFAGSYADARAYAGELARAVLSDRVTDRMPRAGRVDKVLVDVRQNAERLSMVVPYSLRATGRPTISMPVTRADLERAVATRDCQLLVNEASTRGAVVLSSLSG